MNYSQEIVQFLIHSGSIDSVISYFKILKYQRWVFIVINFNMYSGLFWNVSMTIKKLDVDKLAKIYFEENVISQWNLPIAPK